LLGTNIVKPYCTDGSRGETRQKSPEFYALDGGVRQQLAAPIHRADHLVSGRVHRAGLRHFPARRFAPIEKRLQLPFRLVDEDAVCDLGPFGAWLQTVSATTPNTQYNPAEIPEGKDAHVGSCPLTVTALACRRGQVIWRCESALR